MLFLYLQSTAAGQIGLGGVLAVNLVVLEIRTALGTALNQRLNMEGKTVKEQQGRLVRATRIRVLVSTYSICKKKFVHCWNIALANLRLENTN